MAQREDTADAVSRALDLPREAADRLLEGVTVERVLGRGTIARSGDPYVVLVLRGALKLVRNGVVLDVARAPYLLCEPGWDVIALRTCSVARLDGERLLQIAPRATARATAAQSTSFAERIACRAGKTIDERLTTLLSGLCDRHGEKVGAGRFVALPLRGHDLASLVGATVETVSRVFADWKRQGRLRASRDGFWWATLST